MVFHLSFGLTLCIRWRLLFPTFCWSINTKSIVSVVNIKTSTFAELRHCVFRHLEDRDGKKVDDSESDGGNISVGQTRGVVLGAFAAGTSAGRNDDRTADSGDAQLPHRADGDSALLPAHIYEEGHVGPQRRARHRIPGKLYICIHVFDNLFVKSRN
jgi:hypothetical protein